LRERPTLSGRIELHLVISNGRVEEVTISRDSVGDDLLAECIRGRALRWRFSSIESAEMLYIPYVLRR